MDGFLRKVFEQRARDTAEAAPEFALALKTEKLKLCPDHWSSLRNYTLALLISSSPQDALLRALLRSEEITDTDRPPKGF
jgi:hypothetical protein